jgi:hypothetical protein
MGQRCGRSSSSCQHCIPDSGHGFAFDAQFSEVELPSVNTAHQLDPGKRDGGGSKPFEAEHQPCSGLINLPKIDAMTAGIC